MNFAVDDPASVLKPRPSYYTPAHSVNWVEVGVLGLGPVTVDIQECLCAGDSVSSSSPDQQVRFLAYHDRRTKRLWFVWEVEELSSKLAVDRRKSKICGCVGGCNFFGKNTNGVRFFTTQHLDASSKNPHTNTGGDNRYGSESLWGGGNLSSAELGSSIKQHLLRRSSYFSTTASLTGSAHNGRTTSFSGGKTFGSGIGEMIWSFYCFFNFYLFIYLLLFTQDSLFNYVELLSMRVLPSLRNTYK